MLQIWHIKYTLHRFHERFWFGLAYRLPRQLVYFAAIRLIAHATTGKHGNTVPDDLSVMEALKRWDED